MLPEYSNVYAPLLLSPTAPFPLGKKFRLKPQSKPSTASQTTSAMMFKISTTSKQQRNQSSQLSLKGTTTPWLVTSHMISSRSSGSPIRVSPHIRPLLVDFSSRSWLHYDRETWQAGLVGRRCSRICIQRWMSGVSWLKMLGSVRRRWLICELRIIVLWRGSLVTAVYLERVRRHRLRRP